MPYSAAQARQALDAVLAYSKARDYAGFNKHDALNSPILSALCGWAKWPRLLATQLVTRAPLNLRPWLLAPRTRNPKGQALFAQAWMSLFELTGDNHARDQAHTLLSWLAEHRSTGFLGASWGYPYPWQDLGFFAPRHFPNRVVTCWIGLAFLRAARLWGLDDARRALLCDIAVFLTQSPKVIEETPTTKCYSYVPDARVTWAVMDVPALVGAFLAEAGALLGRSEYLDEARRLIAWVVDKQTEAGAWYYTHPPGDSPITHDNYHTAIIIDCLDRYREASCDGRFNQAWERGLRFYEERLFEPDGAPRWMSDRPYPRDIHGAASGILCFTRAARRDPRHLATAERIAQWTLTHMFDARGFFAYQKTRFFTKRFCLMRWCNGWMSWALSDLLLARRHQANKSP